MANMTGGNTGAMRHFKAANGDTFSVPMAEIDDFRASLRNEKVDVVETYEDGEELPDEVHFVDEEKGEYTVPRGEIDDFLKSAANDGVAVQMKRFLGILGTLKTQKEAELGRSLNAAEAVASYVPIVNTVMSVNEKRKEDVLRRLYEGDYKNYLEAGRLAQSVDIPDGELEKIRAASAKGVPNAFGIRPAADEQTAAQMFKAWAGPLLAERIRAREEAQRKLALNDAGVVTDVTTGFVGGVSALASLATKPLAAVTLPMDAVNRGAGLRRGEWTVDENGNPVRLQEGDGDAASLAKGLAGAATERLVWMGLDRVARLAGGALLKYVPGLDKALGKVAGKPLAWSADVAKRLSESEGGRWLLKTGEILGKINDTVHVGSLPQMMVKSRLTELADEVVGLNMPGEGERESFMGWLGKFVSAKDNLELLTSVIGLHVTMGGISALRAWAANRSLRADARAVLKNYLDDKQLNRLSNLDLQNLCRLVRAPGLTAERAAKFIDDCRTEQAEAQRKVDEERSLSEVREGLGTLKERGEGFIDAGQAIADKMKTDAQRQAEATERALNAAIVAAEQAAAEQEAAREAERDELSRIRGAETSEQLAALSERGVTSWEDAQAKGLIGKDQDGRWTGGARQAINLHLNGTEKMVAAVKEGRLNADLAEELLTLSYCELGNRPKAEREALIDRIIDETNGDADAARAMMRDLRGSEATMTRAPETAYEGAVNAERMKGTELRSEDGALLGCERFKGVRIAINEEGILTSGLTEELLADPKSQADVAALLTRLNAIAERTGLKVNLGSENAAKVAEGIIDAIEREGLGRIQRKMETRARLFEILAKTTLDTGVTFTESDFQKALADTSNGKPFVNRHGDIYGFASSDGTIHLNPAVINFNTPIHEYGHLALEAVKKVNPALWKKGMDLVGKSEYYDAIRKQSEKDGDEYGYLKGRDEGIRDEALATLIGDRGARLVEDKGLGAELKAWLKEVWKAFKGAFGVADLSEEQIERMTLGEFVDTINAELLRGSEFGTKKAQPLAKRSVRRFDEDQASGSNGLLRWTNDRGYLFAIPVDMERTQPGGKVVFARDDANITDWIQNALNGYTLRLSKSGRLYVEGRDGLPPELAEIFGRYPRMGANDGILATVVSETGHPWIISPDKVAEKLVEALRSDRRAYDDWKRGRNAEAEHWAEEEARADAEAEQRWSDSGMNAVDYIRSRIDEGAPGFDLDWEHQRMIENDRAEGRFSVGNRAKDGAERDERPYVKFSAKRENEVKESKSFLSDTAASAEVSTLIRRSVAPVLDSLTSMGSLAKLPQNVKGVVDGISSVVESIASGRKVKGIGAPVSVKNLITTLSIAGFNRSGDGSASAYLMMKDRSIRISDHSADAWRFKRDNNLSVKLNMGRGNKPFNTNANKNVIEVTYGKTYLERNPLAFAGMLRDIAEFAATGEFHDTVGAAKIEFSGGADYRNHAIRMLVEDAQKRGDAETANKLNSKLPIKLRVTNQPQIGEAKFNAGPSQPRLNRRNFIAGRAMVAEDYGRGEQTPGAMAASRELDRRHSSPIAGRGDLRRISLPISELEQLRRSVTGDVVPAHLARRIPGGAAAMHNKTGRLFMNADVWGVVDKTDMQPIVDNLKLHGFFRNEDPAWMAAHSPVEIAHEKNRSESQLAIELNNLATRRINGSEPGGLSAARQVFADQVAAIVCDLPQTMGGTLGNIQTVGKGLRTELRNVIRANGVRSADVESAMRAEAEQFLDWAYGTAPAQPRAAAAIPTNELVSRMFGAWLVMPDKMAAAAPQWTEAIETTIANTPQLARAFRAITFRNAMSEQSTEFLVQRIRRQQSLATEKAIAKLTKEAREPIGAGSKAANAKETLLVAFHDRFSPVTIRIDQKVKDYLKAKRAALRAAATPAEKAVVRQEIDTFMGEIGRKLHRLELSRTAYERGAWNEGRRYFIQMVLLENKASAQWGLSQEDRSLYLDLQRIIETQGRSGSDGMSPRQAQIALGDMARRLGTRKWDLLRQYGDEFFRIHEREILDDPRLERALGKAFVDYCRTQTHYVATKRTWSPEELDAIETAREAARRAGVAGGDDFVSQMHQFANARGAGQVVGEAVWTAPLNGSMAAKREVRGATWEKADPLMQFARRNQMVLDLRDALLAAGVTGVRDLKRTDGADYPADPKGRYGHVNYMENGEKRVLVVPRQIADAFRTDPDNASFITKANGFVRKFLIDYNLAYTPQNVKRNQDSLEKNMPGMRETYLKTGLRAVVPGAAPLVDLTSQYLVRKFPAMANLFGRHTVFFHLPKAERWAQIIEDPSAWQRQLWEAEAAHDNARITQCWDDFSGVMEMLKGNFLVPTGKAYANDGTTNGFAFDAMDRKGLRTLEMIEQAGRARGKYASLVDKVNIFKKNQAQNEHEDVLAKTVGYLHDRMFYAMRRSPAESGLAVKRNVSIAEGERSGRLKKGIQAAVAQFFNMVEKGVVRHWRNFGERPGEMLLRDGKVWMGRAIGGMLAYGCLQKWLLSMADDDEEKAKGKFGRLYDYAAFCHRAYQNCSDYVRENYNFTPVWTSEDGYTTLIMGGALTDEDKLIVPTADCFAKWIAYNQGIGERPSLGTTLANSTWKAITPDLQLASPALNLVRDTVEAAFVDNPTDYFRGAPMYDQDLWAARNESWEMRGKFAAAVGARLWNDFGGRALYAPDVNGVDSGRGSAPETLETILRKIPVLSPAIARQFKLQVGSPEKLGEPITDERKRRNSVIAVCAKELVKARKGELWYHERDPKAFEAELAKWTERYGFTPHDVMKLKEKYYNAWIQFKGREAYDRKKLMRLFKEGRREGRDENDMWLMLGEM